MGARCALGSRITTNPQQCGGYPCIRVTDVLERRRERPSTHATRLAVAFSVTVFIGKHDASQPSHSISSAGASLCLAHTVLYGYDGSHEDNARHSRRVAHPCETACEGDGAPATRRRGGEPMPRDRSRRPPSPVRASRFARWRPQRARPLRNVFLARCAQPDLRRLPRTVISVDTNLLVYAHRRGARMGERAQALDERACRSR